MSVVDPEQRQIPPAHPPGTVESASTGSGGCPFCQRQTHCRYKNRIAFAKYYVKGCSHCQETNSV